MYEDCFVFHKSMEGTVIIVWYKNTVFWEGGGATDVNVVTSGEVKWKNYI